MGGVEEQLDFAACKRTDGSIYGTSGKCRKGIEVFISDEDKKKTKTHNDRVLPVIDEGVNLFLKELETNYHLKTEVTLFKTFLSVAAEAKEKGGEKALAAVLSQKQGVDILRMAMNNPVSLVTKEAAKEMYDNKTGTKPGQVSRIEHPYPVKLFRDELIPKIRGMTDEEVVRSVISRSVRTQVSLQEDDRLRDSKLQANLPPGSSGVMARYNHVGIKVYPIRYSDKISKKYGISSIGPIETSEFFTQAAKKGIPFEEAWKDIIMKGHASD